MKDSVVYGYGLPLNQDSWMAIESRGRRAVRKALKQKASVSLEGEASLQELTKLHFNANAIPNKLPDNSWLFIARNEKGKTIAGGVFVKINTNTLVYALGSTGSEGRKHCAFSLIIWMVVKHLQKEASYLDLGTSYKPELNKFKRQFGVIKYPVIFNKPVGEIRFEVDVDTILKQDNFNAVIKMMGIEIVNSNLILKSTPAVKNKLIEYDFEFSETNGMVSINSRGYSEKKLVLLLACLKPVFYEWRQERK